PPGEHEFAENTWRIAPGIRTGWCVMRRGLPFLFKFGSKFVLEVLPSVAATVIAAYLLAQLHFGRASDPPPPVVQQAAVTPSEPTEPPTAREERAAMREVLKARRENAEPPAQVQTRVESQPLPAPMDSIDPQDAAPAKDAVRTAVAAPAAQP